MKNKIFKRVISLVLVVVMAVSTMAVSASAATSASAETKKYTYRLTIKTSDIECAGTDATVLIRAYNSNGRIIGIKGIRADGDMFDRNKTDVVTIDLPEKMANLSVNVRAYGPPSLPEENADYENPNWHLEAIRAELLSDNEAVETCVYGFNKWTGYYNTIRPLIEEKFCFPETFLQYR